MDINTSRLVRGQVWHWRDPLYGDKSEHKSINVEYGEAITRFSRYVIIIQDEETIDVNSVLVIPCSSTQRYETDIEIKLSHSMTNTKTYAQPRKIFSVHPKCLNKYVCSLSSTTMLELDSILVSLICPNLKNYILSNPNNIILSTLASINTNKLNNPSDKDDLKELISDFIDENIIVKPGVDRLIPIVKIKEMFDQYCEYCNVDLKTFAFYLCKKLNKTDFSNAYNLDTFTIRDIEIKGEIYEEIKPPEKETKLAPNFKWTPEKKKQFLLDYKNKSLEELSEQYKIKKDSIKRYMYNFIKEYPDILKDKEIQISFNKFRMSVLNISNQIIRGLKAGNLYSIYHHAFKGNNKAGKDKFYTTLRNIISDNLLTLYTSKESNMIISEKDKYFNEINRLYEGEIFIVKDLIEKIQFRIQNSYSIKKEIVNKIVQEIMKKYVK